MDHIVPRALGGAVFDPGNLRAVCASCHRKRPPVRTDDPCRIWPHLQPGDPPCPRCGSAAPSREW
ncbi:MAG TPA: HNH endonuclease signature motif containing protein [Actinomycetota bacterium]|nr:HNH endonuclease signature motif containing protein [Actinomycetota bacterium]